ncbi:MAG TPA: M20/M25/M40 family metallo-hydrolase, partial [Gemmatimonadaceae bacterium]|nr:M20/M25/M40 family metallo-hydrolase [Gemmatimonadaceae bacterium]
RRILVSLVRPLRRLAGGFAIAVLAPPLGAQPQSLPGYAPAAAATQRRIEADAVTMPDAARARAHARELGREPHVAGTPAQARTRDYVMAQMRGFGLESAAREYEVWMPHPTSARLWRVAPDSLELPLVEPPVADDRYSALPQYPTVNGYSGTGDVTGEVVYVNYGLVEDYATLDSLGVSVKGRIAVARYGRSFRGIKAREAEAHGAVALIMYSDPQDDGYVRGDVYPAGPMRPPQGVQRGSVYNGEGDPTTPGWPSTKGARRLPLDSLEVPRIPVVPIGYGHAAELLRGLAGRDIPQAWQGGLPFRYHVGPGPVRAHLVVQSDTATRAYKPIWNTLATLRGTDFPDEVIVIGAHRDGWGTGAVDNVSGTVSVLEAARALGELARRGERPRRTIVFATWDAEEWGLIGSSEHVEDDSLRLQRSGVAYLNQDVAASGVRFGGGGSPSLRALLRDVARLVPDPDGSGSVYAAWRRAAGVADSAEPAMGDPGGGSDFVGFYNRLGIPHSDWGFGGPGGIYHSAYDTPRWMETFGDTGYRYHAAAARVAAAMLLRLANADVLPYDYAEYARTLRAAVPALEQRMRRAGADESAAGLTAALDRMEQSARAFAQARDAALAGGSPARPVLARVNQALLGVERALLRPEGLRTRPWLRNVVYAADVDNGYANVVFPTVAEAARAGDAALMRRELADLVARVGRATEALERARAELGRGAVGGD